MRRSVMATKLRRAGRGDIAPAEDPGVPPRGDFGPPRRHYAGSAVAQLRASPVARDALVAGVAFALTLVVLGSNRRLDVGGVVLAALATLPLLARRRAPLAVFAGTATASATLNALGYPLGPPFGPTIALFFLANDDRTRDNLAQTWTVVLAMFAVHAGATAIGEGGFPTYAILAGPVVWGGAWIVGDEPAGIGIREDETPITRNTSRFVPHYFL